MESLKNTQTIKFQKEVKTSDELNKKQTGIIGIENNIKDLSDQFKKIRNRKRVIAIIGLVISILGASYLMLS